MSAKTKASAPKKTSAKKIVTKKVIKKPVVKKAVAPKKVQKPVVKAKPSVSKATNVKAIKGKAIVKKVAPKKAVSKKVVTKSKPVVKTAKKVVAEKIVSVKKVNAAKAKSPLKTTKTIVKLVFTKKLVKPVVKSTSKKTPVVVTKSVATVKNIKPVKQVVVKPEKPVKVKAEKKPAVKKTIIAPITFKKDETTSSKSLKEPAGKFEMEFVIRASEDMVYEFVSTESGLSEWFCDDVNIRNGIFTFDWDGQQQQAKLVKEIPPQFIRYQWLDNVDGSYFEFRIQKDELTNDISLMITDFAVDKKEEESARLLWHSQVDKLLHVLGSFF